MIPFYSVLFYSILFYSILFYSILFYSILFLLRYSLQRVTWLSRVSQEVAQVVGTWISSTSSFEEKCPREGLALSSENTQSSVAVRLGVRLQQYLVSRNTSLVSTIFSSMDKAMQTLGVQYIDNWSILRP